MLKVLAELKVCLRAFSVASVVFSSVTPWTVTHQAPLSVGFSRQEYWNWLPRPPPRDLPDPGIEPGSLASPAVAGGSLPLCHQHPPLVHCSTICNS